MDKKNAKDREKTRTKMEQQRLFSLQTLSAGHTSTEIINFISLIPIPNSRMTLFSPDLLH